MAETTTKQDALNAAARQYAMTGELAAGVTKEDLMEYGKQESKRSKAIDKQLISEHTKMGTQIVLLLLGTFKTPPNTPLEAALASFRTQDK